MPLSPFIRSRFAQALALTWCLTGCGADESAFDIPDGTRLVVDGGAPADSALGAEDLAIVDLAVPSDLTPPADLVVPPDLRPRLRRPYDITGIVGTGQSLSVGVNGQPVISSAQPYANLKFSDPNFNGNLAAPAPMGAAFVPLVEPLNRGAGGAYPNNIFGETPHAAMGNELSSLALRADGRDFVTFHSAVGLSGQSITVIRKNGSGNSYAGALYEVRAATALAKLSGRSFGVGAVTLTHGETDWNDMNYEAEVHQLWSDYNTDLKAITGQPDDLLMIVSQQSTFPGAPGSSPSTLAQWKLGVDYPGQILCAGPKYQYEYSGDRIHLTANAYRRLGQKYAQVYHQAAVLGQPWKPLQPRDVKRNDKSLVITFDVPVPPIQWDIRIPAPHTQQNNQWAMGRGFEVSDKLGNLSIVSVAITGPDQVTLVVDRSPTVPVTLGYAMIQDIGGYAGGIAGGRSGQLRDSDARAGYDTEVIRCKMTKGSAVATAVGGDFSRRSVGDLVTGMGLSGETTIAMRPGAGTVTLSAPWTLDDGTYDLSVYNDLHNYLVHFSLPVN